MDTLLCAGGSGLRVLESVLHLCAAGLGPEALRVLAIDPDGANGNGSEVAQLVTKYREGASRFRGRLGLDAKGQPINLFGTDLDLLEAEGGSRGLKIWSPIRTDQRLRDLLGVELLAGQGVEHGRELVSLFFTDQELAMELDQGFRGRPVVGAAAMSLVELQKDVQPWRQLIEKLRGDLQDPRGARVFLVGSVFGGTGASALYPLARFLETVPETNADRLTIAIGALVPYFRFESGTAGAPEAFSRLAARAEDFAAATRAAVGFYQHVKDTWPFRSMYWLGDSSPANVAYAPGGPAQRNPSHFVELLMGLAALGFFRQPDLVKGPSYAGSRGASGESAEGRATLGWPDVPLAGFEPAAVKRALLRFLLIASAHQGFLSDLMRRPELEAQPFLVPWYWDRFARKGDRFSQTANREALDFLDDFFASSHLPWWRELHSLDCVHLFNRAALNGDGAAKNLDRLGNLLWPDREGERDPAAFDEFYEELVRVDQRTGGERGGSAYLALLANAADRYIDRRYVRAGAEE